MQLAVDLDQTCGNFVHGCNVLGVLQGAVGGEGVVGAGEGELLGEHQRADVAEDAAHGDQAAQAAQRADWVRQ